MFGGRSLVIVLNVFAHVRLHFLLLGALDRLGGVLLFVSRDLLLLMLASRGGPLLQAFVLFADLFIKALLACAKFLVFI